MPRKKPTQIKKVLILENGDTVMLSGNIKSQVTGNPVVEEILNPDITDDEFKQAIKNPGDFKREFKNGRFKLLKKKGK